MRPSRWESRSRCSRHEREATAILAVIGSLGGLFDWWHPQQRQVLLDPASGAVTSVVPTRPHWPAPPRGGWDAQP